VGVDDDGSIRIDRLDEFGRIVSASLLHYVFSIFFFVWCYMCAFFDLYTCLF
jgi:hypothetical protein